MVFQWGEMNKWWQKTLGRRSGLDGRPDDHMCCHPSPPPVWGWATFQKNQSGVLLHPVNSEQMQQEVLSYWTYVGLMSRVRGPAGSDTCELGVSSGHESGPDCDSAHWIPQPLHYCCIFVKNRFDSCDYTSYVEMIWQISLYKNKNKNFCTHQTNVVNF